MPADAGAAADSGGGDRPGRRGACRPRLPPVGGGADSHRPGQQYRSGLFWATFPPQSGPRAKIHHRSARERVHPEQYPDQIGRS